MHEDEEEMTIVNKIVTILGVLLFVISLLISNYKLTKYLYIISYIMIGYDIILKAIKHLFSKEMFDENLIMTIATLGAMIIGEVNEAIVVLVLYKFGELLQDKAVDSSKEKIEKVLDLKVNKTTLENGEEVDTNNVKVGDIILIKTGDRVPLDGVLMDEKAQLDMSALNGESMYVDVEKNKEILSGSINVGNAFLIKVIREEKDSAVSKIVELVENASKNKSKTEKYISKFCKVYTPVVILIALVLPFILSIDLKDAIYRSLNFLVISCPCALVISIPLGFFVGMGAASKKGILAKGTTYLDLLTNIDTIFIDKTGTITDGKFEVVDIKSTSKLSEDEILEYLAIAESKSNHVIAASILRKYNKNIDSNRMTSHKELSGYGIVSTIDNKNVICGNYKIMEKNNIEVEKQDVLGTIIYLAIDNKCVGYVILSDKIKEGAKKSIELLHKNGIKEVIMLTGDKQDISKKVANEINADKVYYELLPEDKVKVISDAKCSGRKVAFVGDGINDSPSIASSDVGIAMSKGSDIAVETADIVLMTDEMEKIPEAIKISKRTKNIVNQNITIILIVKLIFLILSIIGKSNMWIAVFADVGITIITIFNSLRIFKLKNSN